MDALTLLQASSRRGDRRALDYTRLTTPQDDWVRRDDPEAYWIDGNSLGKSFAAAWDAIQFMRGKHPYKKRRRGTGPITGLVIGYSYEQMLPLMEKLWLLAPKDELHPTVGFAEGRGFTGKPPRLLIVDRAGRLIGKLTFATYKATSKRIAGGQYDFVILDEPPPESIIGEARPRLFAKRGWLRILMTPVPDMPPTKGIEERMATGAVPYQRFGLKESNCWPIGAMAPWRWQDEIDRYAATLLPHERDMRINGSLRTYSTGRWIHSFDVDRHVRPVNLRDLVGWTLSIGIDHGTSRKQAAVLVATQVKYDQQGRRVPYAAWVDETVSERFTTVQNDAKAIRNMIERNGLLWRNIDHIVGDVPVYSETRAIWKTNKLLRTALCIEYGADPEHFPQIKNADKGPGSVTDGARTINTMFAEDHAVVDPKCVTLRDSFLQVDSKEHPLKDVFDGGRYGAIRGIGGPLPLALDVRY